MPGPGLRRRASSSADFAKRIPEVAFDRIMLQFKVNKDVKDINGWGFTTKTGIYGTDYLSGRSSPRSGSAPTGRRTRSIRPRRRTRDGKAYDGANKYVMRFAKGQLPPVEGFWSLTMYDGDTSSSRTRLNRYSISARQNLKTNPDGSVDLYIQKDSPGADKESNWLPAPAGKFILMLRMYWPNEKRPVDHRRHLDDPARSDR